MLTDPHQQWRVADNPFAKLYVDVTERCNMTCNFCYTPERAAQDIDVGYFAEACRRLPRPVVWCFLGGEPTLHPRFFDLLDAALDAGHQVQVISNGLKWTDDAFTRRFAAYGRRVGVSLSMDGGVGNEDLYRLVNNRCCGEKKLAALENLCRHGVKRIGVTATLVRGQNERVVGELYDLARRYSDNIRWIHYRNAATFGRWVDTEPYDLAELRQLMGTVFTAEEMAPRCIGEINCNAGNGTCCYRFRPTRRLQVSLIEFMSERSARCPHRGKLLGEGFVIVPTFAQMIDEGRQVSERYGRVEPLVFPPGRKSAAMG